MTGSFAAAKANTALTVLRDAVPAVLWKGLPADVFLADYFRSRKKFGSRDRREIRDIIFAWFRWRGAVRFALPDAPEPDAFSVLAALTAEQLSGLEGWAELVGIPFPHVQESAVCETPIQRISHLTGKEIPLESVLPEWAAKRLFPTFAEWFQKRPCVWIRSSSQDLPEILMKAGIRAVPHETIRQAYRCESAGGNLSSLKQLSAGLFEIQDLSSQCIGLTASPNPGEHWLDCCAGAGGKTLQILEALQGRGSVTASDLHPRRLEELKRRAGGHFPFRIEVHDLTKPVPKNWLGTFDGVLADAPCSSSGRWRRNPETRWQSSPGKVAEYAALQKIILEHASAAVKPGGILVYATCSVFEEENEIQIKNFLNLHSDFELDEIPCILPGETKHGMLRVNPWSADCDASFAARLRRTAPSARHAV